MKKKKGIIALLTITFMVFALVLGMFFQSEMTSADDTGLNAADAEVIVMETEEETEEEEPEPTYIELYGLEEVEKPERRTKEQVRQKLKELSAEYEMIGEIYEQIESFSEEMLEHLANNPEMAAYVLGALESDGAVTGGFTEAELEAEYPLLLQFDPRWGYFEYGGKEMGISGCGPTCLSMMLLALTDVETVTPDKVVTYSLENGHYVEGVGTAWKLLEEFPRLYNLTVENPEMKESALKAELDEGKVLICSVKRGVFTANGHFIMIYGYDETGFKVNDPMCVARSNQTWTFAEFGRQLKRVWAYGEPNIDDLTSKNVGIAENIVEKSK